jgi:hypothetical protein
MAPSRVDVVRVTRGLAVRGRRALAALAVALSTSAVVDAQPLAPLVVNWEDYFQLDWQVGERRGHSVLTGHVRSTQKYGARWMQLLVDRVDARGALIDQRLVWLPSEVTRGSQVYFEVRVEPAASYRVVVYAYEPPPRP